MGVEEVDPGDSCSSGFEAGGGIFEGDASESVDGSGGCGEADCAEGFEALARGNKFVSNGFMEDRAEEDDVGVIAGCCHFGERVAGDGDDGWWEGRLGIELADLGGGELAWGGGEVDSVSGGGDGYVEARVDEESGGSVAKDIEDAASEADEGGCGEIFFAELNVVDAFGSPEGGLADEGVDLRGLLWIPPCGVRLRRIGHR